MTPRRTSTTARLVLAAYAVLTVAAVTATTSATALPGAVLAVANGVRRVGHGALSVEDGFVLAMAVTLVTIPVPGFVAGAWRASRPVVTWDATGWGALGAVVAITGLAARSATPLSTWRSLAIAVVVGLLLGTLLLATVRQLRGPAGSERATGRMRRAALACTGVYLLGVAIVGGFGSPVDAGAYPTIVRVLDGLHRVGLPGWFGYAATEFTANVVFFVPFGLLVVLLLGMRRWWVGAAAGFAASAVIETAQALFLPARYASLDDVLSNTSGAVIGAMLGVVVLGVAARRRARAAADGRSTSDRG